MEMKLTPDKDMQAVLQQLAGDVHTLTDLVRQLLEAKQPAPAAPALKAEPVKADVPWKEEPAQEEAPLRFDIAPAAPQPEAAPTVSRADVQALVVKISATSPEKKAAVRDIVLAHAERVSKIPDDKLATVYEQLKGLDA